MPLNFFVLMLLLRSESHWHPVFGNTFLRKTRGPKVIYEEEIASKYFPL